MKPGARRSQNASAIITDSDCCGFAPKMFGMISKNTISRNYRITNKGLLSFAKELVQNVPMKSSIAKHQCKRARHCGLIASGRSPANRDFSGCVRNMNCCFAPCTAIMRFLHQGHHVFVLKAQETFWGKDRYGRSILSYCTCIYKCILQYSNAMFSGIVQSCYLKKRRKLDD